MKLNIAFVTGGLPFTGNTLETGSLGGSETAFLQMTKAMARRGHRVHAFNNCPEPMLHEGVHYHELEEFPTNVSQINYDVIVCSRWSEFLTAHGLAGLKVFWGHDTLTDRSRFMSGFILSDLNILLSDYHISNYREQIKEIDKFTWKSRNGIDLDLIDRNIQPKVPKKVIYTSRPERGLHYLLGDILPKLLAEDPEIVLHYANYDLQGMQIPEHVEKAIEASRQLARMYPQNVKPLGHLTKAQLYQELSSSQLLLYPTDFPEISPVRGDTEVETLGGRFQIKDLVGKKDFHVYSCDQQGDLSVSLVRGVFLTRKNTKMLKLTVKPGRGCKANQTKCIFLTPDHEVMLRDGEYIRADRLTPGDRLKAFHRYRNDWGPGYDSIGLTDKTKFPEHRFVAQHVLKEDLDGLVVDHLDRNTHNNNPTNLEVKTQATHLSEHWKRWTLEEYQRECQKRREGILRFQDFIGKEATRELRARGGHACKGKPKTLSNHVIVSVEEAEPADAYCMEVEPDHNFIANGLVVHNCITALEAMACGTPVISTNDFALKETIEDKVGGILIDGLPTDEEYQACFVSATMGLLNSGLLNTMQQTARRSVIRRGYTWDKIAEEWEEKFLSMMKDRWTKSSRAVVKELIRREDLVMAKILARKADLPDMVARISDDISAVVQNPYVPKNTREVKELYEERMNSYAKMTELLVLSGKKFDKVLDWNCGYAPFGLTLKKAMPDSLISFYDRDPQALKNASVVAAQNEIKFEVVTSPEEKAFDLVFIGNALETSLDPQDTLEKANKHLRDDGVLAFTVSVGPTGQVYKNLPAPKRLWSFLYSDFVDIFSPSNVQFKSVFLRKSPPEDCDVQGIFLVMIGKLNTLGKIEVERRKLTTRPYQTISVCMISHNEEANIAGAIYSVKDVVDNIFVADNSSDGNPTPEIAKQLGASVFSIEFDNFGKARNESLLPAAKSDWILWMDADERLTEPKRLRKYTIGSVFEAFGIKQVHLTVDELDKTYDIPNRLFRNRPQYRFNGLVHEQVEDTSVEKYDMPIAPSLLIPDVHLAHFGYIFEGKRRQKASGRNLALLLREAYECPERKLTKVLLLRDLVNLIKWRTDIVRELKSGSFEHKICEAAVSLFLRYFTDPKSQYYGLAYPMYQEMLMVMGKGGLCYGKNERPPFEVMLGMAQSYGGFKPETKATLTPEAFWVIDENDYLDLLQRRVNDLFLRMGSQSSFGTARFGPAPIMDDTDILGILSTAVGLFK